MKKGSKQKPEAIVKQLSTKLQKRNKEIKGLKNVIDATKTASYFIQYDLDCAKEKIGFLNKVIDTQNTDYNKIINDIEENSPNFIYPVIAFAVIMTLVTWAVAIFC